MRKRKPDPAILQAWQMTSDEFVGPARVAEAFSIDARAEVDEYGLFFDAPYTLEPLWVSAVGGYTVHSVEDFDPFPTVVLVKNEQIVGFYAGGETWVDPEHRGRSLGAELVVAAASVAGTAPNGNLHGLGYSEAGYRTHLEAHRLIVERALNAGLPVPDRVAEEYGTEGPRP